MRPVKFCRILQNCPKQQIGEAVKIGRQGCLVLNSKAVYNRCEIARLTLGEEFAVGDYWEDPSSKEQEIKLWLAENRGRKFQGRKVGNIIQAMTTKRKGRRHASQKEKKI